MATEARALARRIVADVFGAPAEAASPEPVASSEAQLVARRIVAGILAERPPEPPVEDTAPPATDVPPATEEPDAPDAPDAPEAPVGPPVPPPDPGEQRPPEPSVTGRPEEGPPARAGRWILVTLGAAIALAVLFPLAIRALLQLLSMS